MNKMFQVKVIDEFSGAHNLRGYKGKCESLHGHNWKVELAVSSKTPGLSGMVVDFKELKSLLKNVLKELDHKYLNQLPYFKRVNPTSENIAKFIYMKIRRSIKKKKIKITVWETDSSCASYE